MSHNQAPQAKLTTVARFPKKYFLENLSVRSDNSVLVTAMNTRELWYVPAQTGDEELTPLCIHTFEQPLTPISKAGAWAEWVLFARPRCDLDCGLLRWSYLADGPRGR